MEKVYCCNCIYFRGGFNEYHSWNDCYCPDLLRISYTEYKATAISPASKTKHIQAGKACELNGNNACVHYVDKRTKIGKKLRKKVKWHLLEA